MSDLVACIYPGHTAALFPKEAGEKQRLTTSGFNTFSLLDSKADKLKNSGKTLRGVARSVSSWTVATATTATSSSSDQKQDAARLHLVEFVLNSSKFIHAHRTQMLFCDVFIVLLDEVHLRVVQAAEQEEEKEKKEEGKEEKKEAKKKTDSASNNVVTPGGTAWRNELFATLSSMKSHGDMAGVNPNPHVLLVSEPNKPRLESFYSQLEKDLNKKLSISCSTVVLSGGAGDATPVLEKLDQLAKQQQRHNHHHADPTSDGSIITNNSKDNDDDDNNNTNNNTTTNSRGNFFSANVFGFASWLNGPSLVRVASNPEALVATAAGNNNNNNNNKLLVTGQATNMAASFVVSAWQRISTPPWACPSSASGSSSQNNNAADESPPRIGEIILLSLESPHRQGASHATADEVFGDTPFFLENLAEPSELPPDRSCIKPVVLSDIRNPVQPALPARFLFVEFDRKYYEDFFSSNNTISAADDDKQKDCSATDQVRAAVQWSESGREVQFLGLGGPGFARLVHSDARADLDLKLQSRSTCPDASADVTKLRDVIRCVFVCFTLKNGDTLFLPPAGSSSSSSPSSPRVVIMGCNAGEHGKVICPVKVLAYVRASDVTTELLSELSAAEGKHGTGMGKLSSFHSLMRRLLKFEYDESGSRATLSLSTAWTHTWKCYTDIKDALVKTESHCALIHGLLIELFTDTSSVFVFSHRDVLLRLVKHGLLRPAAVYSSLMNPGDRGTLLRCAVSLISSISSTGVGVAPATEWVSSVGNFCVRPVLTQPKKSLLCTVFSFKDVQRKQEGARFPAIMRMLIDAYPSGYGLFALFGHCCLNAQTFTASGVTDLLRAVNDKVTATSAFLHCARGTDVPVVPGERCCGPPRTSTGKDRQKQFFISLGECDKVPTLHSAASFMRMCVADLSEVPSASLGSYQALYTEFVAHPQKARIPRCEFNKNFCKFWLDKWARCVQSKQLRTWDLNCLPRETVFAIHGVWVAAVACERSNSGGVAVFKLTSEVWMIVCAFLADK